MLVLASRSPRRCEILRNAGIPFITRVPEPIDESPRLREDPREYVVRLAREKADAVPVHAGEIILGADTTVLVDDIILGKPVDSPDALRMLGLLSGREHSVITGICLRTADDALSDSAETRVWFAPLSHDEIEEYVSSGEPTDKAGAYAIQGLASKFIGRIEGCYANVVGLPIALVYRHLRSRGIKRLP